MSAVDAAFGKNKKLPSTFYLEATLDANRHVHPVAIMHYLGTECTYGYDVFFKGTQKAAPDVCSSGRVVLSDGGRALRSQLAKLRPDVKVSLEPPPPPPYRLTSGGR